ncbi:MAG: UDP-3-O-(3-hydroxymyristoyl)glucosamine N-acyltransferase [Pyrinomonadaceae bacterium]
MELSELAAQTGAKIENAESADIEIVGAAGLDDAEAGHVTFLSNPRYTPRIQTTRATAIYLADGGVDAPTHLIVLRAKDPYLAYTRALRLFHPEPKHEAFIHESAKIDTTTRVGTNVYIGACVVIGKNVEIDDGTRIFPNVTIYDDVKIGANTTIHSGVSVREGAHIGARCVIYNNVVVGADGFGYAKDEESRWLKIPQVGRVVIEDDVEIGAGTTIDRASVGETRIKRGAKIDNLVQIGHSCTVGEDALICAQTGLAGSSHIGNRVILAGQVGIAGHLKVGDDAVLTAKSATSHDVEPGKIISGVPAFDNKTWLRSIAVFRRLGEMQRTLQDLAKRITKVEEHRDEKQG